MNYCDGWEDPDKELVLPLFLSFLFFFMLSKSSKMLRSLHVPQGSHVRLGCSTFMDQAPSLVAIHFWVHCSPLMKELFAFSLKEVGSGERTMMAVSKYMYLDTWLSEDLESETHPLNSFELWATVSTISKMEKFRGFGLWWLQVWTSLSLGYPPALLLALLRNWAGCILVTTN